MHRIVSQDDHGQALGLSGEVIRIELPRAHAPGSPIAFVLEHDGGSMELNGRTIDCTKKDATEGMFRIRVRLVNLRREQRLMLDQLLSSAPNTAPRTES
ncbi:MAG: hypothetical protein IPJ88_17155 [Myxococcales bacterium]|nr:MAG: hypothetical protein IPJ88_17155 [Myxococcales bacterium]